MLSRSSKGTACDFQDAQQVCLTLPPLSTTHSCGNKERKTTLAVGPVRQNSMDQALGITAQDGAGHWVLFSWFNICLSTE